MTDGQEELRRGKPATQIQDDSKPKRVDDPAQGEAKAKGTHGGLHKTGVRGERPVGKGK